MITAFGCAGLVPEPDWSRMPLRIHGDLSGLEARRPDPWDQLYARPDLDLSDHRAVYLAPVELADDLDTGGWSYDALDVAFVRRSFDALMRHGLERSVRLAREPADGVLVLRARLVEVISNGDPDPSVSVAGASIGQGGAAFELRGVDPVSGRTLFALFDRYRGEPLAQTVAVHDTWFDVREAFRRWGLRLGRSLVRWGMPPRSPEGYRRSPLAEHLARFSSRPLRPDAPPAAATTAGSRASGSG